MAVQRRMICSNCEYQASWTEFGAEGAPARCPRCGADAVRFADYEPSTYGGLTGLQWEVLRDLVERELRAGLVLAGQREELQAILTVAEEEALPAIAAIDEMGVFGFLNEATSALASAQEAEENGEDPESDWVADAREELLTALQETPEPLRDTLVELVDDLCEALAEREVALVAGVAMAAGLGGELDREAGEDLDEGHESEGRQP